uniref:C2H2-type domain-containing protein n=2 Tax=Caenorhabditis japonica TaxID=281687 RepID=A0A8R1HYA5_CAEJA
MGPETTPECVSEDLMQAVTCLRRAIKGISGGERIEEQKVLDSNDAICELTKITGALERCMETQKTVTELLSGKMKCTTCGATSVGLDCQRSSEERRKVSEEEEDENDEDEKCSSIGSQRVTSVDSSSSVDGFEHPIRSVGSSISVPADEEETTMVVNNEEAMDDHAIVMKHILNGVGAKKDEPEQLKLPVPMEITDSSLLDQFLQTSLLGFNADNSKIDTPSVEENEQEIDNSVLATFFQTLMAGQAASGLIDSGSSENGTESSQASPPGDTPIDSIALLESILAETMNPQNTVDATTSAESKAAARKRKSTPMKVPKTENGAGYVCPMEGCNKVFKEKGSVHRHFVTHIGMRFNCDKCKASYTQKHALMLHQKIHSNPDAYQCRGCGTNYTTQNGLRLHRQRNPTCMEIANNTMDFSASLNSSLSKQTTPTKQMVSAP